MANSKKAAAGAAKLAASKAPGKPKAEKKKAAKAAPAQPVFEDTQVAHVFSPSELDHMNVQLRGKLGEVENLEDQKKASMKDFALRIQNAQNEVKMLLGKLNTGEETRPMRALVEFNTKEHRKTFLHPETKAVVGEAPMQPADWQLPMFKPADDGKGETIAPKGSTDVPASTAAAKPKKGPKGKPAEPAAPAGTLPLGQKLDQAAAKTSALKVKLDLTLDYTHEDLLKAFKKAAKESKWTEAQISVIAQQLRLADGVEQMKDTLRPHAEKPDNDPSPFA